MREIKFRAYIKVLNSCFDVEYLHIITEEAEVTLNEGGSSQLFSYSTENEQVVLRQYTGLKDKNGTNIYEGDIVKQEYNIEFNAEYDPVTYGFVGSEHDEGFHIGKVVILASKGVCMRNPLRHSVSEEEPSISNQYKSVAGYRAEVIGNIYENPELIKD